MRASRPASYSPEFRRWLAASAILAIALLGACTGSQQPTHAGVTTARPPSSRSGRPAAQPATVAAAAQLRQCRARDLHISTPAAAVADTMPGTEAIIRFVNTGHHTCTLHGWPTVTAVRPSGEKLAVRIADDHATGAWGWYRADRVAVKPGGVVLSSLLIGTPVAAQDDPACRGHYAWRITPPGDIRPVTISTHGTFWPKLCPRRTEVVVSPLHPSPAP